MRRTAAAGAVSFPGCWGDVGWRSPTPGRLLGFWRHWLWGAGWGCCMTFFGCCGGGWGYPGWPRRWTCATGRWGRGSYSGTLWRRGAGSSGSIWSWDCFWGAASILRRRAGGPCAGGSGWRTLWLRCGIWPCVLWPGEEKKRKKFPFLLEKASIMDENGIE